MRVSQRVLVSVCLSVAIGSPILGCGGRATPPALVEKSIVASHDESRPPFQIQIVSEINDGATLYLKGEVLAKAKWSLESVIVRMTGLQNGEPILSEVQGLRDLHAKSQRLPEDPSGMRGVYVEEGGNIPFAMSMPSEGLTDYQIELLWGAEAEAVISQTVPILDGPKMELLNVRLVRSDKNCQGSECSGDVRIEGKLVNIGDQLVKQVVLGVGFVWKPENGSAPELNSDSEQLVSIDHLSMGPGEERAIRLAIDQKIPKTPGGEYLPVLRVVSAQS